MLVKQNMAETQFIRLKVPMCIIHVPADQRHHLQKVIIFIFNLTLIKNNFNCIHLLIGVWWMYACHCTHVEVIRDQFAGVTSFLQLCETWGLNSGSLLSSKCLYPLSLLFSPVLKFVHLVLGIKPRCPVWAKCVLHHCSLDPVEYFVCLALVFFSVSLFLSFLHPFVWDRVSFCSQGWPGRVFLVYVARPVSKNLIFKKITEILDIPLIAEMSSITFQIKRVKFNPHSIKTKRLWIIWIFVKHKSVF